MTRTPSPPLPGGGEEAAHAERLFALSQDLLGAADARGHLVWVNAAWERTTGWTPAELYERPYLDFMHPEDRAQGRAVRPAARAHAARRVAAGRGAGAVQGRLLPLVPLQRRGRRRRRSRSSTCRRWTSPTSSRPSSSSRASARRSVERTAELERSNAELERFASVVSHDLRQSLTAVSGFLALLESRHGAALPPNAAELLGLRARGRRAHARAGRGPARLRARRALGAHPGARRRRRARASGSRRPRPPAARLEIGELPVVRARPREFEQLLANLIGNGVKFVAPGVEPVVSVVGRARGRGLALRGRRQRHRHPAPARAADLRHVRPRAGRRGVSRAPASGSRSRRRWSRPRAGGSGSQPRRGRR